jgi:hypothetical protein
MEHEAATPQKWEWQVWDVNSGEEFMFTHRMLQWQVSDPYGRPMFNTNGRWPENYFNNMSACSSAGLSSIR